MTHPRTRGLQALPSPFPEGLPLFPGPGAVDPELEAVLKHSAELLCRWYGESHQHGPRPHLSLVPGAAPLEQGRAPEALLDDLRTVMAGAFRPNHPGALAHLDPPPLAISVVADLVASGLNNNLLAEELSPSLTRLERQLCRWLADRIGLGPDAGGVPASGGSLSNLMALVCARQQAGLQTSADAVVLAGAAAHVSFDKALTVMGLPPEALRTLPLDQAGRLSPDTLRQALLLAHGQGRPVLAVVGVAGSTIQGAIDPLAELAVICREFGVWFHVDAAIGGVCGLSDQHRWRVAGLELADSVCLNPQKLLGISKPSSVLLVRQGEHLATTFSTSLPYMEETASPQGGDLGLQGTRGAEVLKLWLGLQHLGLEGIDAVIAAALERRERLAGLLDPLPLTLLPGDLHLLSFQHSSLVGEEALNWRDRVHQALLDQQLWLSKPHLNGQPLLKAVLGNPFTGERELQQIAAVLQAP